MLENLNDRAWLDPPDNEAKKVLKCYFCGDWIYSGDDYYSLYNIDCCGDCLNLHYRQTAEFIDYQEEFSDSECSEIKE